MPAIRPPLLAALLLASLTACFAAAPVAAAPVSAAPASAAGSSAAITMHPRHHRHADSRKQSLNWAGYVRAAADVTQVSATWVVPTVSTHVDGYSSTWVGIDGATTKDGYLIQTGTEADVVGGRRAYRAWWEIITPDDEAPETVFPNLVVHPGDSISASVARLASGKWSLRLRDNTSRHSASHTAAFSGPGSSAEWIQEDTYVGGAISAAPDWGSVTMSRCRLDGANPHLRTTELMDLVDRAGTREAATGATVTAGDGFTVTWLAAGTPTQTS